MKFSLNKFLKISTLAAFVAASVFFVSCDEDGSPAKVDFDRKAMLENWADNILIPAFAELASETQNLKEATQKFSNTESYTDFLNVRQEFSDAYLAFQNVKAFQVGPSENVSLKAAANTYPVDTQKVINNSSSGNYTFDAANNLDAQGFPALDYLLYGSPLKGVQFQTGDFEKYIPYLVAVSEHLDGLAQTVSNDWDGYRNDFVNASGTDIGSSLGQMVNAVNKDYELIKNAKIGFPSGRKTLGQTYPHAVESFYGGLSILLAKKNLEAIQNFYQGTHFKGVTDGLSLKDFLEELETPSDEGMLHETIDQNFEDAIQAAMEVPQPLSVAVDDDKEKVDAAYEAVQKNVRYLKSDMSSALGVVITYQDNDGD